MNPLTYLKLGAAGLALAALLTYHVVSLNRARDAAKAEIVNAVMVKTDEVADASERARMRVLVCTAVDGMRWNSAARKCERVP